MFLYLNLRFQVKKREQGEDKDAACHLRGLGTQLSCCRGNAVRHHYDDKQKHSRPLLNILYSLLAKFDKLPC